MTHLLVLRVESVSKGNGPGDKAGEIDLAGIV